MEEGRRSDPSGSSEEPSATADELVWADSKKVERDREDFFRFVTGRTDQSYDDEPDREPLFPFNAVRNKESLKRAKRVFGSLGMALAMIASLLAVSAITHNTADALIADGSCPGGGIIEPGETVFGIAKAYGVNAQRIIELNNLTDPDLIIAGQCLNLGLQTACNGHIVASGETLTKIGNRYGLAVTEILALNTSISDPNRIKTAQCLLLADPGTAVVAPEPVEVEVAATPEAVANSEVRETVDEIIEDMESTEVVVENIVADIVAETTASMPDNMSLEEVVVMNMEILGDISTEIDHNDLQEVIEEVHAEAPPLDEADIRDVPREIEAAIKEAVAERVQEELENQIGEALEAQQEIDSALAYLNVLSVPDPGPVSMDQAWEWYRNGGDPKMEITDVARMLRWAGFCTYGVEELVLATATVGGESGFRPYAIGDVDIQHAGDVSVGFGQIYWSPGNNFTSDNRRPELNIDPRNNVQTMFGMYEGRMNSQGWDKRFADWYGHGPGVANHGDAARQAVSDIGGCE